MYLEEVRQVAVPVGRQTIQRLVEFIRMRHRGEVCHLRLYHVYILTMVSASYPSLNAYWTL